MNTVAKNMPLKRFDNMIHGRRDSRDEYEDAQPQSDAGNE
jgi:hypothetical protein